jgi:uncharacterized protein
MGNSAQAFKQFSELYLRAGLNESAYRQLSVPFCTVRGGVGPTVLVLAGVHGDEYEGQVFLNRFAIEIDEASVPGCLILVPCANPSACASGARYSAEDGGNLAVAFSESSGNTITEKIAQQLDRHLFSKADAIVDLHSGGRSLIYNPCTVLALTGNAAVDRRSMALAQAIGFEQCIIKESLSLPSFISRAAERRNIAYVATELGGAGALNKAVFEPLRQALRRILASAANKYKGGETRTIRYLVGGAPKDFLSSKLCGIFETAVALGDEVRPDDVAGWLHQPLSQAGTFQTLRFTSAGIVVALRPSALCHPGDCLIELAVPCTPPFPI